MCCKCECVPVNVNVRTSCKQDDSVSLIYLPDKKYVGIVDAISIQLLGTVFWSLGRHTA